MAKTKITLEIASEIAERLQSGEKRVAVYQDYPFNSSSIVIALRRYGLWTSKRKVAPSVYIKSIIANRERLENGSITAYELGKELGCSPSYVSVIARKQGIKLFYSERRGKRKSVPDEVSQQILDHLKENGGTINSSSRALGMSSQRVQQAVRSYARRIGFEPKVYRVAHQRYGLWKVLPGIPEPCYTSDYRVDALCTGCGKVHRVMLCNMRAGVSSGCHVCRKNQGNIPVLCRETQDTYVSIMSMTKDLGIKNYQSVRIALDKTGIYEHEGFTYVYSK